METLVIPHVWRARKLGATDATVLDLNYATLWSEFNHEQNSERE